MKVLVIDDEESIRCVVRGMLETVGFAVVTAESGEEGLKILRENGNLDLVWTDWQMPGINGEQVIAEAKRIRPGQPAVLFTATEDVLTRLKKTPGDFVVLAKPATMAQVINAATTAVKC
jgi:DNA-binding NtrC family response regulator